MLAGWRRRLITNPWCRALHLGLKARNPNTRCQELKDGHPIHLVPLLVQFCMPQPAADSQFFLECRNGCGSDGLVKENKKEFTAIKELVEGQSHLEHLKHSMSQGQNSSQVCKGVLTTAHIVIELAACL